MRRIAVMGMMLAAGTFAAIGVAEAGEETARATAVVKGKASLNKTGIAAEEIRVQRVPADPNAPTDTVGSDLTDGKGKYRVGNLPPGKYRLAFVASLRGHTPTGGPYPRTSTETDCKIPGYEALALTTRGDYPAPGEPAPTLTVLQLASEKPFKLKADQEKALDIKITCPKGTTVSSERGDP